MAIGDFEKHCVQRRKYPVLLQIEFNNATKENDSQVTNAVKIYHSETWTDCTVYTDHLSLVFRGFLVDQSIPILSKEVDLDSSVPFNVKTS